MRRHPLPDVDFPNEWEDDIAAPIFPGGRIENINAADAYTIFTFASSILRASTPIKNRKRQVASGSLGRNLHASMRDDTPCFSRISGRRRLTQNPPIAIGILKHRVSAPRLLFNVGMLQSARAQQPMIAIDVAAVQHHTLQSAWLHGVKPSHFADGKRDQAEDYARIILRTSPYGSASIRLCTSNIIVERVCAS